MDVIPVPLGDQLKPQQNIRTRTFFIVQECLDEDVLRTSLDRLIRDHWRKLGGRLVTRKDGLLEYHVPNQFDERHALFQWSSQEYGYSIDKVASEIRAPATDKGPQMLPSMNVVDSWFRPPEWPYHCSDEQPNSPFLYVHLSLFSDATVICMGIPHPVADQMGVSNIMSAWLDLVEGKEPPPFVGYEEDILPGSDRAYEDYPKSETFRKGRQRIFRRGEYFFVVLPFIPDLVINSKEDTCILFLPLPLIQSLRERYSKTLTGKHADFSRISDGDVISSIMVKLARMNKKTPRTMSLSMTVNLRGRVPELGPEQRKGFIHNSLHTATARMQVGPTTPVSEIAYATRQAIEEAMGARDIEIGTVITREMVRRGQANHTCEPFDRSYHTSNWCAAWKDLDFSSAVKSEKKEQGKKPKFLVLGQSGERKTPLRFSALIMSRSEEGYWVQFSASKPCMKLVKEYLVKDPNLENL